jgi:hypothetical protein
MKSLLAIALVAGLALHFGSSAAFAQSKYSYNPNAKGSTPSNRVRPTPAPTPKPLIQMPKLNWVDPGSRKSTYVPNYGPGTSKSGPAGQSLYVIPGRYQGGSSGYSPGVTSPGRGGSGTAGQPRIGYDDDQTKR